MTKWDNNNRGVLFKNEKDGVESRADYRGSCEIEGVEMWIDAWVNTTKERRQYLSLKFKPKATGAKVAPRSPPKMTPPNQYKEDIPF